MENQFKLNFDIDEILKKSEASGALSAKQISEIKALRNKGGAENTVSPTSTKTAGAKAAGIAGVAGEQLTASDPEGTDETTQAVGGAATGAASGFAVGGPWGAAIGGVVGGVQGALQAKAAKEKKEKQIEANRVTQIANIQNTATQQRNSQVNNLISSLSQTLVSGR